MPKKILSDTQFETLSCSKNHCLGIQGGKVFSWGFDGNTGRLGLGYEYFDEEDVTEKKMIERGRKEQKTLKSYDELIETPQNLNYLNTLLAKKFLEEKKAIQKTLSEAGKLSVGKASVSRTSNRDKSSTGSGIFEQQHSVSVSSKKSKLKNSKSKLASKTTSKQAKISNL